MGPLNLEVTSVSLKRTHVIGIFKGKYILEKSLFIIIPIIIQYIK